MKTSAVALAAGTILFASACSTAHESLVDSEQLEPYSCGSVDRIHTFQGVFLASQPGPGDFRTASEGGIRTVVNLRAPGELDWDEEATVGSLGMEYIAVPFSSPAELDDEVFDSIRALLRDESKRPLLVHCSSANRVGAVWIPYRVLDTGVDFETAHAEAKTIGLRLPAYSERAKEYIESR